MLVLADPLSVVHESLLASARAPDLDARLRILAAAAASLTGGPATIVVRDEALEALDAMRAEPGAVPEAWHADRRADGSLGAFGAAAPIRGVVWRKWLRRLHARRARAGGGDGPFVLDLADAWVRRELGEALCGLPAAGMPGSTPDAAATEPASGLILGALAGRDGVVVATLVAEVRGTWPPQPATVQGVELLGQQVTQHVAEARLSRLAGQRAERLQHLQEAGAALARSLDEQEIVRELSRQVLRLVPADGIVVAHPDLERGVVRTAARQVRGLARGRADQPLGAGPLAEAARTGLSVRVDDYDPARSPLAAADDVVGDAGPAGSVLAAPMRVGTQLVGVVAVHAGATHAFRTEHEELLRAVAAQAGTAIANARLFAESEAERRQSEALADVARAVGGSLRIGEVLRLILRHTSALLRAGGACVALQRDDYLHVVAGVGAAGLLSGVHVPVASSMMGRAVRDGRPYISNDVPDDDAHYRPLGRLATLEKAVLVPLVTAQGPIGVIAALNRDADFVDADARVLQRLADHVAVAIVNARLFEEVTTATREWKVAFDAIAAGMVVLDEQGAVVRCNQRAAELVGAPGPKALLGRDFREALGVGAPSLGASDVLAEVSARGETARGTLRMGGGVRRLDVVAAPHPDGGTVVTFDDVTAHHALAERYRLVVETSRDAIVITDLDGRIAFANAAAHELFGRGPELVGIASARLVADGDVAEMARRGALARDGAPQRYEVAVLRPDGTERAVAVASAPLGDVGQVTGVVAMLRDVTEERAASDALAASEARYRELLESADDAIYTLDARGVCTSANGALARFVGLPAPALIGLSSAVYVAPEDLPAVREHFEATLRGEPRRFECRMVSVDGTRRLLSVTHTPLRGADGTARGILAVSRDVTAERERAAALERSEARYERLVESATDAIFTCDAHGRVTSVNHALERAAGRTRAELLGTSWAALLDGDDREAGAALLQAALRGERVRRELRLRDAQGATRVCSVVAAPIVERGAIVGGLAVVRDVTDERRLAEQLMQRERLATVGGLVRGVAHELNNPLASVLALSDLLLADDDAPHDGMAPLGADAVRDAALAIRAEARRASRIIGRLHAFARQRAPERVPTDLNRVLLDALDLRRYALRMQEVDIVVDLDYELPVTWADPIQLQQVLLQLVTTAEQALAEAPTGERRLELRTRRDGERLEVTFRDTGPGYAPESAARLLDPFAGDAPDDAGLAVASAIVREHGGRIRVESAPGAGATLVVELPFVPPPNLGAASVPG